MIFVDHKIQISNPPPELKEFVGASGVIGPVQASRSQISTENKFDLSYTHLGKPCTAIVSACLQLVPHDLLSGKVYLLKLFKDSLKTHLCLVFCQITRVSSVTPSVNLWMVGNKMYCTCTDDVTEDRLRSMCEAFHREPAQGILLSK